MIAESLFESRTLTGLGVFIAAIASLLTAVGTLWTNYKLNRVREVVEEVKQNGNGKEEGI